MQAQQSILEGINGPPGGDQIGIKAAGDLP
jgi:hypothetical protein